MARLPLISKISTATICATFEISSITGFASSRRLESVATDTISRNTSIMNSSRSSRNDMREVPLLPPAVLLSSMAIADCMVSMTFCMTFIRCSSMGPSPPVDFMKGRTSPCGDTRRRFSSPVLAMPSIPWDNSCTRGFFKNKPVLLVRNLKNKSIVFRDIRLLSSVSSAEGSYAFVAFWANRRKSNNLSHSIRFSSPSTVKSLTNKPRSASGAPSSSGFKSCFNTYGYAPRINRNFSSTLNANPSKIVKLRIIMVKKGGLRNSNSFSRDISSSSAWRRPKLTSEAFPVPPVDLTRASRSRGTRKVNWVVSFRNPSSCSFSEISGRSLFCNPMTSPIKPYRSYSATSAIMPKSINASLSSSVFNKFPRCGSA
mmetsp:Transcript_10521/g.12951  ORF Transcript_10521/g.12951 Transcript_10521/m.12951 type:complete len:371 (-) Transcript_10521:94-1206(-)